MLRYLSIRLKSFGHAWAGLVFLMKSEPHARIHLVATIMVLFAAWRLDVSRQDWLWLILAITLVWISEAINTAIEYLCDVVSPELSQSVRRAKDIAATAVLVAEIAAALIGVIVFIPYIPPMF